MSDSTQQPTEPVNEPQEGTTATDSPSVTDEAPEAPVSVSEDAEPAFDAQKALEKIKKANAEARSLRERAKQAEQRAESAEQAEARAVELEAALVRERVARRMGLPDALVDRLRGASEEEVLADAESLMRQVVRAAPRPKVLPVETLSPGSGPADSTRPNQLTQVDLESMKPQAIEEARLAGRLDDLLAGRI